MTTTTHSHKHWTDEGGHVTNKLLEGTTIIYLEFDLFFTQIE